jgi:hypothetical protein
MDKNNDLHTILRIDIDAMVRLRPLKSHFEHGSMQGLIPDMGCLLEAIDGVKKSGNISWLSISLGKLHVDLFSQLAINEHMRDVN